MKPGKRAKINIFWQTVPDIDDTLCGKLCTYTSSGMTFVKLKSTTTVISVRAENEKSPHVIMCDSIYAVVRICCSNSARPSLRLSHGWISQ